MKLSVITTLYKSSMFLEEFCQRAISAAQKLVGDDYELILINDGSPDDSIQRALELQKHHEHIKIVDLSRNFGHHAAIVAGLELSIGERVFLMDCDLEEHPEWLSLFSERMDSSGADVIYGVQQQRTASRTSNFFGELFWSALNFMSSVRIPHNPMTCRLMTRKYVDSLLTVQDRVLYLAGTFAWAGFTQIAVPLTKTPRTSIQKSSYNLSRKLMQVADSFASFSVAPLILLFFTGLSIWLGSILFAIGILIEKILFPQTILSGFTSIMISIWFLGGTIILGVGVTGLYIAKIFQETKRRPLYIVRETYGKKNEK
ncbi:glycosyltransferase family 2 protein [Pseudomonas sp. WS 5106]|uniref:Glycosyltransferase family 2 protein n=1 Tax=Pseudomonas cremoris TaxID=2724178 RepID=A0A7X1AU76_9PSED|nr:glycosyltransferase family 2 protein [Pseudomonas cremoris]MBC2382893.1 glycosyltransferase family 2 protein [Pseudomonas cremoris]MBC2409966.1 glycosyltransferase family 2 protein [Pseudomonas cremoris]